MSELWQVCGSCGGSGSKTENRQAVYYTDTDGNKLSSPVTQTVTDIVSCIACGGTGSILGGVR
jgi:hypothetical protein